MTLLIAGLSRRFRLFELVVCLVFVQAKSALAAVPTLKEVFANWIEADSQIRTCELSISRFVHMRVLEIDAMGKSILRNGPLHDDYAKAFSDFLDVNKNVQNVDRTFFDNFTGRQSDGEWLFKDLNHYWERQEFKSDRKSFRFEILRDRIPKREIMIRHEARELRWSQFEKRSQANVVDGDSGIVAPEWFMFSRKPTKYIDLIGDRAELAVGDVADGFIRYSGPGFTLEIEDSDYSVRHFRFERPSKIREDWFLGSIEVDGLPGVVVPKASLQLISRKQNGDVARVVGWGDCASYVVDAVTLNEELPSDVFALNVPAETVVIGPGGNRSLARGEVDVEQFVQKFDPELVASTEKSGWLSKIAVTSLFVIVFGSVLFGLYRFLKGSK